MRKYIVLTFSFLFIIQNCYGQSGWFWQNPFTPINDNSCISFKDASTGLLVNEYRSGMAASSVYRTTNGGVNWNQIIVPPYSDFYKVQLFGNIGFLIGARTIYRTSNSGLNWNLIKYQSTSFQCDFVNEDIGFFSNDSLRKTTDGGFTWHIVNIGPLCQSLYFVDSNIGFYIGNNNTTLFRTSNGGLTWNSQLSGTSLKGIYFLNQSLGFIAKSDELDKTTDQGLNWNLIGAFSSGAVFALDVSNYFVTCPNGTLFRSTNGGTNWLDSFYGNYKGVSIFLQIQISDLSEVKTVVSIRQLTMVSIGYRLLVEAGTIFMEYP